MKPKALRRRIEMFSVLVAMLVALGTFGLQIAAAQKKEVVWSADEKPLADQIHGLRGLADDVRAGTTKDLALKIRKLPATSAMLVISAIFFTSTITPGFAMPARICTSRSVPPARIRPAPLAATMAATASSIVSGEQYVVSCISASR